MCLKKITSYAMPSDNSQYFCFGHLKPKIWFQLLFFIIELVLEEMENNDGKEKENLAVEYVRQMTLALNSQQISKNEKTKIQQQINSQYISYLSLKNQFWKITLRNRVWWTWFFVYFKLKFCMLPSSKKLVQTRQKFQFIKLYFTNSIFQHPSAGLQAYPLSISNWFLKSLVWKIQLIELDFWSILN